MDTVRELAQWSLAFLLVAAGIAYSMIALLTHAAVTGPPDWMSVAIGTAIGYYFGQKASQSTMHSLSNGVTSMMSQMAAPTRSVARAGDPTQPVEAPAHTPAAG